MADVQNIERHHAAAPADIRKMLLTALIGMVVGAIAWGGGVLISRFIIEPVFCATPDSASICQTRDLTTFNIALVLGSFVGLLVMVRSRVYRPLLISIAATVTLWSVLSLVSNETWILRLLWVLGLSALAYALYGWISQLRSFAAALIITVIVVVGIRLLPNL